jgi:dephospho-CoA kinase
MKDLPIIGVTGSSGAGKGVVCELLSTMGACVIDTDKIAHAIILRGQPAYNEIVDAFGNEKIVFLDDGGEIMRRRLADIVFGDAKKLQRLTMITHKYIVRQTLQLIDEINKMDGENSFIVIDAPLLIEAGLQNYCDAVIGVVASEEVRIGRIMERDGLTYEQASARIGKQTPLDTICKHADFIIGNNDGIERLRGQIVCFVQSMLENL